MQTYSHFIVTAAFDRPIRAKVAEKPQRRPRVETTAILVGSILPDMPLTLLAIFTIARDMLTGAFNQIDFDSLEPGMPTPAEWLDISMTMRLFDIWFFENPWMIAFHNLFHSPLLITIYIIVSYWLWTRRIKGSGWFFWLSCAAMFHTLVDIPLHTDDGPLLLFPLNWKWRYASPLSYWDPQYYGREWSYFEHTLDLLLLLYLVWFYRQPAADWFRRRRS